MKTRERTGTEMTFGRRVTGATLMQAERFVDAFVFAAFRVEVIRVGEVGAARAHVGIEVELVQSLKARFAFGLVTHANLRESVGQLRRGEVYAWD
jgi:hypothetical protein